ncbi:MAG: BPSS1780 family membrane protein [Marinicellaceae bacterium]
MPLDQDTSNSPLFNVQAPKKLGMIHGWQWVNEGFRYFTYSKLNWLSSIFVFVITVLFLINYIPIIQVFLIVLLPLITAGLGLACYEIERGNQMNASFLIKGFMHPHNIKLLRYGLWLILLMIIAQMIGSTILISMGVSQESIASELQRLGNTDNASFQSIMASPVLLKYFVVSMIMMIPIMGLNLLAPYLLVFSQLSALESIKFCFAAFIKNIAAIFLYALIYVCLIAALLFVLKLLSGILDGLFAQESFVSSWIELVATLLGSLFIASLSYCSAYVAYKDIFLGEEI